MPLQAKEPGSTTHSLMLTIKHHSYLFKKRISSESQHRKNFIARANFQINIETWSKVER